MLSLDRFDHRLAIHGLDRRFLVHQLQQQGRKGAASEFHSCESFAVKF